MKTVGKSLATEKMFLALLFFSLFLLSNLKKCWQVKERFAMISFIRIVVLNLSKSCLVKKKIKNVEKFFQAFLKDSMKLRCTTATWPTKN